MSFPRNNGNLGLEPSVLNVLPGGENVFYDGENKNYIDSEGDKYVCSVYISGMDEFKDWARKHDKEKIVVGGYHPTMFPEKFLDYAEKIVIGPCDDLEATVSQKNIRYEMSHYDGTKIGNSRFVGGNIVTDPFRGGNFLEDRIVSGILNFQNIPRFDLYDINNNQQIIPDKKLDDLSTSINSSFGCPYQCDFCCTPVMFGPKLISKPLTQFEREVNMIDERLRNANDGTKNKYIFIRDENFTLQRDYRERLEILKKTEANIYLFASANTLSEKVVDNLAENNSYMVCLGLEDPTKDYAKNKKLDVAVQRLKDRGIYTYLSFIVDPLEVVGAKKAQDFYLALQKKFEELKPEMVCGNFLMPFPGTPLWDKFYHLVSEEDFKEYDSKTPFLVKNPLVQSKMEYFMFKNQWDYYASDMYNDRVRKFDVNDTLYLRFLELQKQFEENWGEIRDLRP